MCSTVAWEYTITIAGIEEGSDENEPFTDYTPEKKETTISSSYPIKNSYPIEGPNMLSLTDYKYDEVGIHLDNVVETRATDYIRLCFDTISKEILQNCYYTGVIMTYYLPPTTFVSAGGYGIEKMCIYRIRVSDNVYSYKTDALILQNGAWTLNLVDIDDVMFLFDLTLSADYSPRNMYQLGLSRIVVDIKAQTLFTDKTIICEEIIANNSFQYQPSLIPNFSAPKEIGETVVGLSSLVENSYDDYPTSKTLWYIDFGYEPDSDEFKQLGLGQEFRFIDEVAGYEFKAKVVEDSSGERYWKFDNGTVPYKSLLSSGSYSGGSMSLIEFVITGENNHSLLAYCSPNDCQYFNYESSVISNPTSEDSKSLVKPCADKLLRDMFDGSHIVSFKTSKTYKGDDILMNFDVYNPLFTFPSCSFEEYSTSSHVSWVFKPNLTNVYNQMNQDGLLFPWTTASQHAQIWIEFNNGLVIYVRLSDPVFGVADIWESTTFTALGNINRTYIPTLTFSKDSNSNVIKNLLFTNKQGLKFYIDPDHLEYVTPEVQQQWDMKSNLFSFLFKTGRYKIYPLPENTTALYTDKNIITDRIIVGRNIESFLYSLNEVGNQVVDALIDISNLTQSVRDLASTLDALEDKVDYIVKSISNTKSSWLGWLDFGLSITSMGFTAFSMIQSIRAMSNSSKLWKSYRAWRNGYDEVPTFYDGDDPLEILADNDRPEGVLLTNDDYVHVPWYLQNASSEQYELVRHLVENSKTTYEDVEFERINVRHVFGDSLPLFDYEYVGKDLHDSVYDTLVHRAYNCYCEVRSAIRNVFECGTTDFFNKFEQETPKSAIIQTPNNVEFRVDSITFDSKSVSGFADKDNTSTWTSDKLVSADLVLKLLNRINQLETRIRQLESH